MLLVRKKLEEFFMEDWGDYDLTTESIFSESDQGTFTILAKQDGVFAGSIIIEEGYKMLQKDCEITCFKQDGNLVKKGEIIAEVSGRLQSLLTGERVILNLIQRMSGIATITREAVSKVEGSQTRICDTRKTTPGLRIFEKYAVRCGGGFNHRNGLYDSVLIKDNHIEASGSITNAIQKVKMRVGHTVKIEVEIESEQQLHEAIRNHADIIMFDNLPPAEIKKWVKYVPDHIVTEASGGITLDRLKDYAETGIQYISLGYLTHSAPSLDFSMNVKQGSKGGILV
ncbi:carboxylating nicotinate-nucleotide diphosphorylase [Bacillus carboniphilus]|uniref:nicotinate-nucleotide diphosphorylase (carboxylating) n=1 Tax=Bacillus carboniphilus TaxID=86663 RepID=A0ABN0WE39_9BACI